MKASRFALSILLAAGVLVPHALEAQSRGRGNGPGASESTGVTISFASQMVTEIRRYYDAHPVASVEGLPPGIRKNLARGKPLPPGIAKKVAPGALVSELSLPSGYELVEVGWDVLLIDAATSLVQDVLTDVLR